MTEDVKPARSKKRWLLWLLVVLVTLPLLLAIAAYGLMRSPLLHSQIWPRIQPIIAEESGFQVELGSLKVDLLGHIQATGIQITNLHPQAEFCEDLQLSLGNLELQFRPWALLSNELHIDLLAVQQLDVTGCLLVDLPAPEEPPAPVDPQEQLDELLALLNDPPLQLHLHRLLLEAIQADLRVEVPSEQLQLSWQGQLDLDTALHWTADQLKGQLNTQLISLAPLIVNQEGDEQLQLSLKPQVTTQLGWALNRNSPWRLELSPLSLDLELADLQLKLNSADLQLDAHWPHYSLHLADSSHFSLLLDQDWPLELNLVGSSELPEGHLSLSAEDLQLQTAFQHGLRLEALGQLDLLKPDLEQLQIELASSQGLQQLQVVTDQQTVKLNSLDFTLQAGSYGDALENSSLGGDFLLGLDLNIQQLETEPLLKTINLNPSLQIKLKQDFSQADLSSQILLDDLQLLDLELLISNLAERLELQPRLSLLLPLKLQDYLAEAAELQEVGELAVLLEGLSSWEHGQQELFQADFTQMPWGQLRSELQITTKQTRPPKNGQGLQLIQPLVTQLQAFSNLDAATHQLDLQVVTQGVQYPPLLQPLPFSLELSLAADEALTDLQNEGQIQLNHQPFINWQLALDNAPQLAGIKGQLELQALPEWQTFIAELAELDALGPIKLEQNWDLQLQHPEDSLVTLDPETLDGLQLTAQLKTLFTQLQPPVDADLQLQQPLKLEQKISWSPAAAEHQGRLNLPQTLLPEGIEVNGINLNWQAKANSGLEPTQVNLDLNLLQERLYLPEQADLEGLAIQLQLALQLLEDQLQPELSISGEARSLKVTLPEEDAPLDATQLVFPFSLKSLASIDLAEENLNLSHFELALGDRWLEQTLTAEARFDGSQALVDGKTLITLRDDLLSGLTGPMQGSGQLHLPWSISLVDERLLSLQALAEFEDLNLQLPEAGIQGMQGQISIQQDLLLQDLERLSFRYLLRPDAFQRVDFNRVEPWLDGRQDFRIAQMRLEDLTLGPLEATLPIKQNLIQLQDFSLAALGGEVAGQFYLDINPAGWRLGLLSRVSRIDLRQLLPETLAATRYAPVNARTAIEFDFSQRLVEGRVDLTDINRIQLLQILDIIDPDHRDPQLATARSGLRATHPRWVRVEMQNGLMDLTLSLSLFRDPIQVRNLPLSPLIERFAEEALLLPELLPLESAP